VTALIKVVMMLRNNLIPPQAGMPCPLNTKFPDLDKMNVQIPGRGRVFKAPPDRDERRKMILNNFDAAVRK
jgi:hypothetical protein